MMIDKEMKKPSLHRQCKLLSLCRSGLYYISRGETEENLAVMRRLDEQYLQTPFYGERRLLAMLRGEGYHINIKRLRRLMRIVRWRTIRIRRRKRFMLIW